MIKVYLIFIGYNVLNYFLFFKGERKNKWFFWLGLAVSIWIVGMYVGAVTN